MVVMVATTLLEEVFEDVAKLRRGGGEEEEEGKDGEAEVEEHCDWRRAPLKGWDVRYSKTEPFGLRHKKARIYEKYNVHVQSD